MIKFGIIEIMSELKTWDLCFAVAKGLILSRLELPPFSYPNIDRSGALFNYQCKGIELSDRVGNGALLCGISKGFPLEICPLSQYFLFSSL